MESVDPCCRCEGCTLQAKSCPAVETAHLRMAQTERVVLEGQEGFVAARIGLRRTAACNTCRQSCRFQGPTPNRPAASWFFGWHLLRWEHPWLATCCCKDRTRITHSLPLPRAGSANQLSLISPPVSRSSGPLLLCWQRAVSATHSCRDQCQRPNQFL